MLIAITVTGSTHNTKKALKFWEDHILVKNWGTSFVHRYLIGIKLIWDSINAVILKKLFLGAVTLSFDLKLFMLAVN